MKKISIVSPCYNEEENIPELYRRLTAVMLSCPQYDYEIILADNKSTDGTREVIRALAKEDKRCFYKIIKACSDTPQVENFTSYGPYDRCVIEAGQLIFIGVLGEYIGAIWTQVKNKPLVIEEERINF